MASTARFQLFPPPPPKIHTGADHNLRRKTSTKSAAEGLGIPLQTLVKSPATQGIVIQVVGETGRIQPLPQAHIGPTKESSPSIDQGAATQDNKDVDDKADARRSIRNSFLPPPPPFPPQGLPLRPLSTSSPSPSTRAAGQSSNSGPRSQPTSPDVPMRSMFPTYNPNIPLSQQQYYPQRETGLQGQVVSREEYSPNMTSPSRLDEVLGGAKTAPSSVLDFPMDDLAVKTPRFSSARDLDRLWGATNGQEPDSCLTGFDLHMSRYELPFHLLVAQAD
jgi:hypothetical protein